MVNEYRKGRKGLVVAVVGHVDTDKGLETTGIFPSRLGSLNDRKD